MSSIPLWTMQRRVFMSESCPLNKIFNTWNFFTTNSFPSLNSVKISSSRGCPTILCYLITWVLRFPLVNQRRPDCANSRIPLPGSRFPDSLPGLSYVNGLYATYALFTLRGAFCGGRAILSFGDCCILWTSSSTGVFKICNDRILKSLRIGRQLRLLGGSFNRKHADPKEC